MLRIGIFGGCFDPIHYGHLLVMERAIEAIGLDEIILVPAYFPPHGKPPHEDFEHRVRMTKAAVADRDSQLVSVSEIEQTLEYPSFSYRTVEAIEQRLFDNGHEAELFFILGGDEYMQFPRWTKPNRIVERAKLLVVTRDAHPIVDEMHEDFPAVVVDKASSLEINSTDMREAIADGRSIRYLTPDPVRAYIDEYRLYRKRVA